MPRNMMDINRSTGPALLAALLLFASAPADAQQAQVNPFQQLAAASASAAAQTPEQQQQAVYPPYPDFNLTGQQQQPEVKTKRVLYEDLHQDVTGTNAVPQGLKHLQNLPRDNQIVEGETGMPFDIRRDALKEAAISYGARGGLAWRTYYIRLELEKSARSLDKVYDFSRLLIPAPSGLLIEPPVISESLNAMLIEGDGQQAAVSDAVYNIVNNAKIVSAPRTWRNYLEREWGEVEPPPDILRPENNEEQKIWNELVEKGWGEGLRQADEIFQDDLNVLQADFQGMIRYRILLTQGMVSPPYALQVDRGVTGGGDEMRVGDRAVQITGVPELITGSEQWQPASR